MSHFLNAASIYVFFLAIAIAVKSMNDSAAVQAHLSLIEEELEIMYGSEYPYHRSTYSSPARRRMFVHSRRRQKLRHKIQKVKRAIRKGRIARHHPRHKHVHRTGSIYKDPRTTSEIEIEPIRNDPLGGKGVSSSIRGTPLQTSYRANADPKVFVFPFGEATNPSSSYSFYSAKPDPQGNAQILR